MHSPETRKNANKARRVSRETRRVSRDGGSLLLSCIVEYLLGTGQKVLEWGGGGGAEQRGGGPSVSVPLVRGRSFNFQRPLRGESSCFFMGIDTHLIQSANNKLLSNN